MEKISRTHTTMELLREIQIRMTTRGIKPEEIKDRITFMSMYNEINWSKGEEIFNECFLNSLKVRDYAHRFPKGHWSFFGIGNEEKWYGMHIYKPEGKWNHSADVMMLSFVESGHPVFRAAGVLDRGFLRKKGGTLLIQLSGDLMKVELLFRTINSVNYLSIYGAVADWCEELAQQIQHREIDSESE